MYPRQSPTTHTEQLGEEASVYDWARKEVHALNPTAACVWRQCDGATSPDAIAAALRREMGTPEADAVVELTLRQLACVHLLELPVESRGDRPPTTRRWLLGRGVAAAMLPAIYSIVAPAAVEAQSPGVAPTLTSVSPNQGIAGTTVPVTLTGTNFVVGGTTVNVASGGVTATNVIVSSATSLTADIVITAAAVLGAHTVSVTTTGGTSGGQTFTVNPPAPGAPTLTSVAPNLGTQGTTVPVTLTGTNFVVGATTVNITGTGVTINTVVVANTTSLTANFVLDPAAAVGARTVTVTTAAGTSGGQTFTINLPAPGAPTLTSVAPNLGIQGTTVPVTLTGTNFVIGATTVNITGTGVTINTVVVANTTSLTANFVLDPAAAVGARTVTVTTAAGTSGGQTFTINLPAPGAPTLTSVAPNLGTQGTTVPVTLTGTNFVIGATTVNITGTGVTINTVVVANTTSLTANFVLDPAAAVGARTVTVTTAAGTSGGQTFTINLPAPGAPTLTSVAPNLGTQGTTVPVTLTGTNFVIGATTVNITGTGVTINTVVVANTTSLTANFVLDPAAAVGARTVTVTTAGGTSGGQTFTVNPPPPTLTSVAPNLGTQGTTVPVTLTGTNFVIGATTVNITGAGVTVNTVVVGSTTSLTANFVLDPAATVGARTVTVTTAGGTSGGQTFTINLPAPGAPTLTTVSPNQGLPASTVAVTLTGTNFVIGATTVAVAGGGVTVNTVVVGSATSLTANFVVDAAATAGPRTVTVTTAGGTSGPQTFTITLPPPGSAVFPFTGGNQTFTVPAGVVSILIEAIAPQGGAGSPSGTGGLGGRAVARVSIAPGTVLTVRVGGQGQTGVPGLTSFNGGGASSGNGAGGGGGATSVLNGATPLVIAGGGGGSGRTVAGLTGNGGNGGDLSADPGQSAVGGGGGGGGGSQGAGGAGGAGDPGGGGASPGTPGTQFTGGTGGASNAAVLGGGGGGGGWFGGGGGGGGNPGAGGGGGGSSFTAPGATNVIHQKGLGIVGQVIISWP